MTAQEIIDLIDNKKEFYFNKLIKKKFKERDISYQNYFVCLCLLKKEILEKLKNNYESINSL